MKRQDKELQKLLEELKRHLPNLSDADIVGFIDHCMTLFADLFVSHTTLKGEYESLRQQYAAAA